MESTPNLHTTKSKTQSSLNVALNEICDQSYANVLTSCPGTQRAIKDLGGHSVRVPSTPPKEKELLFDDLLSQESPCRLCPHVVVAVGLLYFDDSRGYAVDPLMFDRSKVRFKTKRGRRGFTPCADDRNSLPERVCSVVFDSSTPFHSTLSERSHLMNYHPKKIDK